MVHILHLLRSEPLEMLYPFTMISLEEKKSSFFADCPDYQPMPYTCLHRLLDRDWYYEKKRIIYTATQSQKPVSAYSTSERILPFRFAGQYRCSWFQDNATKTLFIFIMRGWRVLWCDLRQCHRKYLCYIRKLPRWNETSGLHSPGKPWNDPPLIAT